MASKTNNTDDNLKTVLLQIEHEFGKGSVIRLGDQPNVDMDCIPSGSILLDECLGIGGYPKGRIVEIYGPESSGKTTLALTAVAEVQKRGGTAAFIDAENSIDPDYAKNLGVDIDNLILSQPNNGEEALEIVERLAKSGVFSLIVVDSVAALVPQQELEGMMTDSNIGLQARLMSKAMRKITAVLNKNDCTVIFINQIREKVGVIYGSNETTTGGRALKFFSSIRIDIRRSEAIKEGANIIGNVAVIKVVKNKVAPPFKSCKVDIIYGKGISKEGELLDLAVMRGIVHKKGVWYEVYNQRMGQGRDTAKQFLAENPEIFEKIKNELLTGELPADVVSSSE
ncbi:MAG: recombinase RecA [Bacilli bacterium]|nr:recombinase RecA [Bacilli bacterium]